MPNDKDAGSAKSSIRLKVPTLASIDKTPTPTRLLRAVTEIGLFQDEEHTPHSQQTLNSARSTSSNNPFDEHFRKATASNLKPGSSTTKTSAAATDQDVLNTPNILHTPSILNTPGILPFPNIHDLASAPPSASVLVPSIKPLLESAAKVNSPPKASVDRSPAQGKLRTLLPSQTGGLNSPPEDSSAAQLLLKFPGGQTMHLSKLPFVKMDDEGSKKVPSSSSPTSKSPRKRAHDERIESSIPAGIGDSKKDALKERNRAAAHRSRLKKKQQAEHTKLEMDAMAGRNKLLLTENEMLRKEVVRLKNLLDIHQDCDVTKKLNHQDLLRNELLPKAVHISSNSAEPVQLIQIDPRTLIAKQGIDLSKSASVRDTRFDQTSNEPEEIIDIVNENSNSVDDDDALVIDQSANDQNQEKDDQMIVVQNPRFLRVTPNSISVKPSDK